MTIIIINHFVSLIQLDQNYSNWQQWNSQNPLILLTQDISRWKQMLAKTNKFSMNTQVTQNNKSLMPFRIIKQKISTNFYILNIFFDRIPYLSAFLKQLHSKSENRQFQPQFGSPQRISRLEKITHEPKINKQEKTSYCTVNSGLFQQTSAVFLQTPTNLVKNTSKTSKQDTVQSKQIKPQPPLIQEQPLTTVINTFIPTNKFEFSPSKNFQLDFGSDKISQSNKQVQQIFNFEKEPQIKDLNRLSIQFDKINNNQIDYENYAGISTHQLNNSLEWMQLKYNPITQTNQISDSQREYYEQKYKIDRQGELPICVVIPSFNNAVNNRHISNMNSILMQEYANYHIVFIDDASTDSTAKDVIQLFNKQVKLSPNQYNVIRNKKQMKAMHNLRMAANIYCKPQEILIVVDGDDELIGRQVFKLFNANFQLSGAWFVYSNFLTANNYVGYSRIIPPKVIAKNEYRKYPFVTSHLRAFYAQLFRNIKEHDLKNQKGQQFSAANDVAICLPILQQAQDRVLYVPQITYYYNSDTGLNNHFSRLKEQKQNYVMMRSKKPYARLQQLFS